MTEEELKQKFAEKLQRKMEHEGIDQRRLAMRSGISESSISKYISGDQLPKLHAVVRIAKALQASLYELIPIER